MPKNYRNRSADEFLEYLSRVENAGKEGWNENEGKWYPHQDPSGLWTIGRGILIGDGSSPDSMKGGLSAAAEDVIFRNRVKIASQDARKAVGDAAWSNLDPRRRQMLTDYAYNLGPNFHKPSFKRGDRTVQGFPKFTAAVVAGDEAAMAREGYRYGTRPDGVTVYPLEGRIKDSDDFFYDGAGILSVDNARPFAERATARRKAKAAAAGGLPQPKPGVTASTPAPSAAPADPIGDALRTAGALSASENERGAGPPNSGVAPR